MTDFVSLHNHTSYSILDSLIEPKALFKRAAELGQTAVAICDHGTLASMWPAWKVSQETGVKLIAGCECYFQDDAATMNDKLRHVILLAKNAIGYKNLLTLNKKGFDSHATIGKRVYSVIDWKLLEQYADGLICLTACGAGIISALLMKNKMDEAEASVLRLKSIFGDNLGLEVFPNNLKRGSNIYNDEIDQVFLNRQLINLGKKHDIRVVATCNAHYLNKEDADTHDVFLTIGAHQTIYSNYRLRYPVPEFYLKTGDEVKAFFSRNYSEETAQQLCDNSVYFANLCEVPAWIDPKFSNSSGKEFTVFPVKDEPDYAEFVVWRSQQTAELQKLEEDSQYLRFKCLNGFNGWLKAKIAPEKHAEYMTRIETELSVLDYQGFSSYMLIVADYVNWAKNNGVPTGPGRGSGGGSMVGYLIGIHEADPIKYDLIFERFQTKGKLSPPDYDLDFGTKDRYKVIDYINDKYGADYVAHISNFNSITPKVYVKDISRVCELGGSKEAAIKIGNDVADIIPAEVKSYKGLSELPLYSEYAKRYPEFEKYHEILGQTRNFSTHAAAVVIGKRPLVGLVPLRRDKDGVLSVEYEKNMTEENSLVKMDLLGLTTLDIIVVTNQLIQAAGKTLPVIDYDLYDKETYDLITSGNTYGVFQFGVSGGTIDLCKKVKPKNIDDLSIITTLARPAAADIRKDFIETREGKRPCVLLHPLLAGAFGKTFGFGLYDESILKLGADVAGWDLNEADRLRKMIKEKGKYPEKDKKLRQEFIACAIKNNGLDERMATMIWDNEIKKFAGYTFNRSLSLLEPIDVYAPDGTYLQTKMMRDILVGDYVRSRDENTKQEIFVEVIDKHDHGVLRLVEIELTTGEKAKCTMNHKFRVQKTGAMLPLWKIIEDKAAIVVDGAQDVFNIQTITEIGEYQTYDLEVDHPDHQFYLSNGMLTSNSHATTYSMISYHTAYLKAHYPVEFLMANLMDEVKSNAPHAKEDVAKIKKELRKQKVKILPPDINKSQLVYTIDEGNKLITGLDAIKFVGDDAIKDIIAKRPFKNFFDFMVRVSSKAVRANNIQALAACGAMDSFGTSRKSMYLYCSDYRKKLQTWMKRHDVTKDTFVYPFPDEPNWTVADLFALETHFLGEAFVCPAPKAYGSFFSDKHNTVADIKKAPNKTTLYDVRGIVTDFFEFKVKKEASKYYGQPMLKATIEDDSGDQCMLTVFPDRYDALKNRIKEINRKAEFGLGIALRFSGNINCYQDDVGVILDKLFDIAMPPALPEDLKAKKIDLRKAKMAKVLEDKAQTPEEVLENIEDALFDAGLIDLDDDEIVDD